MCTRVQLSANRVSINEMVVRGRDDAIPAAYEHWDITFFLQCKFEDLIRPYFMNKCKKISFGIFHLVHYFIPSLFFPFMTYADHLQKVVLW